MQPPQISLVAALWAVCSLPEVMLAFPRMTNVKIRDLSDPKEELTGRDRKCHYHSYRV